MPDYVVETSHLSKQFGTKLVLTDFNLTIERGGIHAVVGSNGAGKSTLFRILLGFMAPSAGETFVLGENSQYLSPCCRGRVGYVNEEHALPTWMKVDELKKRQQSFYPKWCEATYQKVIRGFDVHAKQKIKQLSRGERAGVNLAMALAQKPELLILDEPTLGLDVVAKASFLESVLLTTELNATVIYCSHQIDEIERLADELIILEQGQLKSKSCPSEFCERVSHWMLDATESNFLNCNIPGLLNQKQLEDQCHLYVLDHDKDFHSYLQSLGATNIHCSAVGLDVAVQSYLTKNHAVGANKAASLC
jgi:ABC-2 type transport system ATP-binding protein